MPEISAILTTYNRCDLLPRAIRSILSQTYQDFELLIVDDASEDDTARIVSAFSDSRIRYIRHKVNCGEAQTRNTGIRNAQGRYIAYLDDDDEWMPEKLEKQVALLAESPFQTGLVYTGHVEVDLKTGREVRVRRPTTRGDILSQLLEKNLIFGASALVKRECFDRVGLYDPSVPFGPDYEMWIRIARFFEVEVISEPLYRYSIHDRRLSSNFSIQVLGTEKILEIHKELFARHRRARSLKLLKIGLCSYLSGNAVKARSTYLNALRDNPWNTRLYKFYLLSFLPRSLFLKLLAIREKRLRR